MCGLFVYLYVYLTFGSSCCLYDMQQDAFFEYSKTEYYDINLLTKINLYMKRIYILLLGLLIISGCEQIKSVSNNVKNFFSQKVTTENRITDTDFIKNAHNFSSSDWTMNYIKRASKNGTEEKIFSLLEGTFNRIEMQSRSIIKRNKRSINKIIKKINKGDLAANEINKIDNQFAEGPLSGKSIEILLNSMISQNNAQNDNDIMYNTIQLDNLTNNEIIDLNVFIVCTNDIMAQEKSGNSKKEIKNNLENLLVNCISYNYSRFFENQKLIEQMIN